jgi:hypothetical protein
MKNTFTLNEMENMFEIGRTMQAMYNLDEIVLDDSKDAFLFALKLAMDFENEYPDTEDYYDDIDTFVNDNIPEEMKLNVV